MEFPPSDPPPLNFSPPSNFAQPANFAHQTYAAQPVVPTVNHPPYEEMIRRAILALNEKEGSSRQKISKYIENEFNMAPSPTYSYELTQQLRKMKNYGQLVLVRHSYMLPGSIINSPPTRPQVTQPSVGPYVQVFDGPKRSPGRPTKLQPIVGPIVSPTLTPTPTPTPTPSPSTPVGFAAFSPKQLGVPTTNLFGGLTSGALQFAGGPVNNASPLGPVSVPLNNAPTIGTVSGPVNNAPTMGPVSNVPTMGHVTNVRTMCPVSGPVISASTMGLVSGPVSNVPTMGHVTNVPTMCPVSGPVTSASTMGLVSGPVSNASTVGLVSGPVGNSWPVFDPGALAKVGPTEQIDESPGVESNVDSVMVGVEPQSTAGPLVVVSAAQDPSVAQNNDGPTTVLGKRGRGRPPKINGGPKKVRGRPAMFVRKGCRGRPKKVAVSTIRPVSTLRPRGRPRKNGGGAIVAVDGANGDGPGVLPVEKMPRELRDRPVGCLKKDVTDTASLTSEMQLMAYQGLKARVEHYQSRIKTAVSVVKPYLSETAVIALGALQDLEDLANMDIISVPVNAQSAPVYVQSAPVDDLNPPVTAQNAPVEDLNAPVNVQDTATESIQSLPSTAENAPLTFQSTLSTAENAPLTFQSATVQGQQEPPLLR